MGDNYEHRRDRNEVIGEGGEGSRRRRRWTRRRIRKKRDEVEGWQGSVAKTNKEG